MSTPDLILGTAQLITDYGITRTSTPAQSALGATRLLAVASDLGITTLDTAPAYGDAERVIGESGLAFRIHTKVRGGMDEVSSLKASLEALRVEQVDVLYLHDINAFDADPTSSISGLRRCLGDGAAQIGVSVYTPDQLRKLLDTAGPSVVQFPLNILDRRFLGRPLDDARAAGFTCLARSAFLQGVLLGEPQTLVHGVAHLATAVESFDRASQEVGLTRAVAALAWVANQTGVDGVIVGAAEQRELEEIGVAWRQALEVEPELIDRLTTKVSESDGVDPRHWTR